MTNSEFYALLGQAIDTTEDIQAETVLASMESYDSLAVLGIMAMADGSFGKKLTAEDFAKVTTVASLMEIIGTDHFVEG